MIRVYFRQPVASCELFGDVELIGQLPDGTTKAVRLEGSFDDHWRVWWDGKGFQVRKAAWERVLVVERTTPPANA